MHLNQCALGTIVHHQDFGYGHIVGLTILVTGETVPTVRFAYPMPSGHTSPVEGPVVPVQPAQIRKA